MTRKISFREKTVFYCTLIKAEILHINGTKVLSRTKHFFRKPCEFFDKKIPKIQGYSSIQKRLLFKSSLPENRLVFGNNLGFLRIRLRITGYDSYKTHWLRRAGKPEGNFLK